MTKKKENENVHCNPISAQDLPHLPSLIVLVAVVLAILFENFRINDLASKFLTVFENQLKIKAN